MNRTTKSVLAGMAVAIAIAGYVVFFAGPSPAYRAYEAYADALARGRFDDAAALSTGQAKALAEASKQGLTASGAAIFNETAKSMVDTTGIVAWIRREVKSERADGAGGTQFTIVQAVCRLPPSSKSAICTLPVASIQDVKVRPEGGRLLVSSFNEERARDFKK